MTLKVWDKNSTEDELIGTASIKLDNLKNLFEEIKTVSLTGKYGTIIFFGIFQQFFSNFLSLFLIYFINIILFIIYFISFSFIIYRSKNRRKDHSCINNPRLRHRKKLKKYLK